METLKDQALFNGPKQKSRISDVPSSHRQTQKKLTYKSGVQHNEFSKSTIRRINSISENMSSLFKQNLDKLLLYLNTEFLSSGVLEAANLQTPEISSTLSDGVYILIQGSIKVITFSEEAHLPKASIKEIASNLFRKVRTSKESGVRSKDLGSELVKKNSNSDKNPFFYTCASLEEPFTVFQCANENCCCFSTETVLYKLDKNEIKNFKYDQNKQKLKQLIQSNGTFFKTNFMLFQTFVLKKLSFRNQFKVDNVAVIKKGALRVFLQDSGKQKNLEVKNYQSKRMVCQLREPSILVKGFTYEVSSCESQIIFIDDNETFEFIRNPQWVERFSSTTSQSNVEKINKKIKVEKKASHTYFRKAISKMNRNESVVNSFISAHQTDEQHTGTFSKSFHITKQSKQACWQSSNHRKTASEVQNISSSNKTPQVRLLPHQKQRKNDMLKTITPYVLISQKTGLKEIKKTRSILNERNQNLNLPRTNSPLNSIKTPKSYLSKHQTQYSQPFFLRTCNLQSVPDDRRFLLKYEKFLQSKNQRNYQAKIRQNNQKLLKGHRKSLSELTSTASANFYFGLKKTSKAQMERLALQEGGIKQSSQLKEMKMWLKAYDEADENESI